MVKAHLKHALGLVDGLNQKKWGKALDEASIEEGDPVASVGFSPKTLDGKAVQITLDNQQHTLRGLALVRRGDAVQLQFSSAAGWFPLKQTSIPAVRMAQMSPVETQQTLATLFQKAADTLEPLRPVSREIAAPVSLKYSVNRGVSKAVLNLGAELRRVNADLAVVPLERKAVIAAANESLATISKERGALKSISTESLSTYINGGKGLTAVIEKDGRGNLHLGFVDSGGKPVTASSKAVEQIKPLDLSRAVDSLFYLLRSRLSTQRQAVLDAQKQAKVW